jgi:hypothetical protein
VNNERIPEERETIILYQALNAVGIEKIVKFSDS